MTSFLIQVVIDPRQATPGARKVRSELEKTEGAAAKLRKTLTGALGVLALGAGIASATRTLAGFGQEMSSVAAITQATGADFARLEEQAKSLGTNTRFSATQAAEGMTFLARAGFDAQEVFETIGGTLNLAQAGALGLGEAADIASNALTAFRLETSESGRVVDVLALAANSANTTVTQLADGLKLVAPIAAGVGVEIEETTAAISALSNAGLQATLAGTGLRRIISELESPSSKTRSVLSDLGLETKDYRVSAVGLTAALKELADAGVDTGLGLELFGDRGGPAFEVLRTSISDVEAFTEALRNADGTAQRIAATMDDNLNGSILATKSAIEGFVLAFGDAGATSTLKSFFDAVATGTRFAAENIDALSTAAVTLGAAFAAVKLVPLGAGVLALASSFIKLRLSLLAGTSVMLGSATATQAQAFADNLAAKSAARRAVATLAATEAQLAETVASGVGAEVDAAALVIEQRLVGVRAANVVASDALAASQTRLASANAATTASARLLSVINPFAIAVAGVALAGVAFNKFLDELTKVEEKILKIEEAGSKFQLTEFGKVGDDIVKAQKALDQINATIQTTGETTPAAAQQIEILTDKLDALGVKQGFLADGTAKTTEEAEKQIIALEQLDAASRSVVTSIERENSLLRENARERQIQSALLQEIADLEGESGLQVTGAREAEIESALRRNQVLSDQAAAFDAIRGPQENFSAQVEALRVLQEEGRISTEEQTAALLALAQAAGNVDLSGFAAPGGGNLSEALLAQQEATRGLAEAQRDRARALAEIEGPEAALLARMEAIQQLETSGAVSQEQATAALERNAEALQLLNPQYALQAALIEEVNGPTERLIERQTALEAIIASGIDSSGRFAAELENVRNALNPLTEEEQRRAELLESIQGKDQDRTAALLDLKALYDSTAISAATYREELEKLNVTSSAANTASAGFSSGLKTAQARITDVRGAAENLAINGFQKAEDALVEFATTGKLNFSSFAQSLLSDIARLLIKQALLAAIGGGGGEGAAGGIGALFGARADGGPVSPNGTFLVGEEGPEFFSPETAGNIIPAGETAAILNSTASPAAPVVNVAGPNVNIQNVIQEESPADFDDAVINTIQRNPRTLQGLAR